MRSPRGVAASLLTSCRCAVVRRRLRQVAYQGLTPDMAIRACNNPKITSSALSRVLSDLVLSTAKNEIERIRQQARAAEAAEQQEAVRSLLTLASNSPEGDDGNEGAAARTVSPALSSTSPSVNSPAKHVQTFLDVRFHTPYLKGRATHFQRKVASKIEALTRDQPPRRHRV